MIFETAVKVLFSLSMPIGMDYQDIQSMVIDNPVGLPDSIMTYDRELAQMFGANSSCDGCMPLVGGTPVPPGGNSFALSLSGHAITVDLNFTNGTCIPIGNHCDPGNPCEIWGMTVLCPTHDFDAYADGERVGDGTPAEEYWLEKGVKHPVIFSPGYQDTTGRGLVSTINCDITDQRVLEIVIGVNSLLLTFNCSDCD